MADDTLPMPIPEQPSRPPRRVQLSRRKGAHKPQGAVVVSRPSKWGNPLILGAAPDLATRAGIVARYRAGIIARAPGFPSERDIRAALRGRDLACWCPLDEPCHADVLLEIANS